MSHTSRGATHSSGHDSIPDRYINSASIIANHNLISIASAIVLMSQKYVANWLVVCILMSISKLATPPAVSEHVFPALILRLDLYVLSIRPAPLDILGNSRSICPCFQFLQFFCHMHTLDVCVEYVGRTWVIPKARQAMNNTCQTTNNLSPITSIKCLVVP